MRPSVVHLVHVDASPTGDKPRVEVIHETLWSDREVREAVLTSALTSGLVCALAGLAFGFYLGIREGGR